MVVFLSILAALASGFIPYFLTYLTLEYAIITFLLTLLVLTNVYFMLSFSSRMRKVEKASERHSLVLDVIIGIFIKLQKVSGSKGVTMAQFAEAFSESIEKVLGMIMKDYFSAPFKNPGSGQERRKQELLQKAQERQITYEEGQELQRLLEEQKRQHESRGDIGGAILVGLMILFIIGVLAVLFGDRDRS
jgi:cbb3-type cytochrome oxidase subunit 3